MKYFTYLLAILCLIGTVTLLVSNEPTKAPLTITVPPETPYVGKINVSSNMSIRLLVLKHCPDSIADRDSAEAIQAANLAMSKGLTIKDIGDYHVNPSGLTDSKNDKITWGEKYSYEDLSGLKNFISEQMKVSAEVGDTLVIYTIGHGSGNGSLMRLGQREGVMKIIAEAAGENEQETLWWQLSCHACASLPPISSLTEQQKDFFTMVASSPANRVSYFMTQGEQLEKLFLSIAAKDGKIDSDKNGVITAQELTNFLNKYVESGRGDLVFAREPNEPIFGWWDWANMLPIIGIDGTSLEYPDKYIPLPKS